MKSLFLVFTGFFFYITVTGQSWMPQSGNLYSNPTTTNVGIGLTSPSAKLHIKSSSASQYPLIVSNDVLQSKLIVHQNGGVSIGNNITPPIDGLAVENNFKMNFMKWMGFGPIDEEGQSRLLLHHTGVHGYIDFKDNLHFRADRNWISALTLYGNGSVGIGFGTTYNAGDYRNQGFKLAVNGGIVCEEIKVVVDVPDADFVFENDYKLMSLDKVESFVKTNKHLPDIPSAESFKENGYKVGEMDGMLLRKIEELTLYILQLKKEIDMLKSDNVKTSVIESKN